MTSVTPIATFSPLCDPCAICSRDYSSEHCRMIAVIIIIISITITLAITITVIMIIELLSLLYKLLSHGAYDSLRYYHPAPDCLRLNLSFS